MSAINDLAVDVDAIQFNDPPSMVWIPVQAAGKLLWVKNPKLHSLGVLETSMLFHGFQSLPKFDVNLENVSGGQGAIKAGNGRIETLALMENNPKILEELKNNNMICPRGLGVGKNHEWIMPILAGTDAKSLEEAMAYAIDDNNLTMYGSDFDDFEIARMWDAEGLANIVEKILEADDELVMPVTIAFDDAPYLLNGLKGEFPGPNPPGNGDKGNTRYKLVIYNLISYDEAEKIQKRIGGKGQIEEYTVQD